MEVSYGFTWFATNREWMKGSPGGACFDVRK